MFSREKKMQGKRMQLLQKNETNELSLWIEFNVETVVKKRCINDERSSKDVLIDFVGVKIV